MDLAPAGVEDKENVGGLGKGRRGGAERRDEDERNPPGAREAARKGHPGAKAGEGPRPREDRDAVEVGDGEAGPGERGGDGVRDRLGGCGGQRGHRAAAGLVRDRQRGSGRSRIEREHAHQQGVRRC